jgi:riboflavin kinase/FMN adenylyltransferase
MEIINSLKDIKNEKKKLSLTIGNFDGLHCGHRSILKKILKECSGKGCELVVMTFIPHPKQLISPNNDFLINSYEERRELFKSVGIKYVMEIDFTRDFSTLQPAQFLDLYLLTNEKLEDIYLGHDFSFGANKSGNFEFAKKYCSEKNVLVHLMNEFKLKDDSVSSSEVRRQLKLGNIQLANKMLTRPFYLSGRVIKGEGRGRQIGFPTANLQFAKDRVTPSKGVYITKTKIGDSEFKSITNIGNNPTFNDTDLLFVETHVLDFEKDIYGEEIKVLFLEKIRDEKKFNSVDELIAQIETDSKSAKQWHKENA